MAFPARWAANGEISAPGAAAGDDGGLRVPRRFIEIFDGPDAAQAVGAYVIGRVDAVAPRQAGILAGIEGAEAQIGVRLQAFASCGEVQPVLPALLVDHH